MKHHLRTTLLVFSILLLAAGLLHADDRGRGKGKGRGNGKGIPPGHLPPAGACRVWYEGLPPGHQPAPTDCRTARRQAARTGGVVVYGSDAWGRGDRGRWDERSADRRRGRDDRYDRSDRERRDRDRRHDRDCAGGEWLRGGCDGRVGRPRLPDMVWGVMHSRGRLVPDLALWLPVDGLAVRLHDEDRDGVPEDVVWYDEVGRVIQQWHDGDRDGRADVVAQYRDGRVWRTLR